MWTHSLLRVEGSPQRARGWGAVSSARIGSRRTDILASVWDLFSWVQLKLLPGKCLGDKQGRPDYSCSFVGKEGLPAEWVAGPCLPLDLPCGRIIEIRNPPVLWARTPASFGQESCLDSHLPASHFSVASFSLTLRTLRSSQASSTNSWGVHFWSWSKSTGIMKIGELFKQYHTKQQPTYYHHTKVYFKIPFQGHLCLFSSPLPQIIESWMEFWLSYLYVAVFHPAKFYFCFCFSVAHVRTEFLPPPWSILGPLWPQKAASSPQRNAWVLLRRPVSSGMAALYWPQQSSEQEWSVFPRFRRTRKN